MIKRAIKQWLSARGYTIIKTNPEEIEKLTPPQLPSTLFENSRVSTSREDVLQWLPKGGTIAEVGVGYGYFSALLLQWMTPRKFIAIDTFAFTADTEPWKQTLLKNSRLSHQDYYKKKFREEIEKGQLEVHAGLSWEMLEKLPDNSLDYVYLDAGHSYEEVVKDIAQVKKKVKDTGIIQFNDYALFDAFAFTPYGVPKAVHEFMIAENYELLFLCLHRQFFSDIVVRKKH